MLAFGGNLVHPVEDGHNIMVEQEFLAACEVEENSIYLLKGNWRRLSKLETPV